MEYIILSMLIFKAMTIYDMRTYIKKNLSTVCSDSLGSIQTAIKNLLKKDYILVKEYQEKGKLKKEYSVTKKGVEAYKEWIGTSINTSKMKSMESGKLYFLGVAPADKRISFLEDYIKSLKEEYDSLLVIKQFVDSTKDDALAAGVKRIKADSAIVKNLLEVSGEKDLSAVVDSSYRYQIYMLDYGLMRSRSDIEFYENILKLEKKNKRGK